MIAQQLKRRHCRKRGPTIGHLTHAVSCDIMMCHYIWILFSTWHHDWIGKGFDPSCSCNPLLLWIPSLADRGYKSQRHSEIEQDDKVRGEVKINLPKQIVLMTPAMLSVIGQNQIWLYICFHIKSSSLVSYVYSSICKGIRISKAANGMAWCHAQVSLIESSFSNLLIESELPHVLARWDWIDKC